MASHFRAQPIVAWRDHLLPRASKKGWFDDSRDIDRVGLPLSNRELFGAILLALIYTDATGASWDVGYDPHQSEPNDGFVSDGTNVIRLEHKCVHEKSTEDVLAAIIHRYKKAEAKGEDYGKDRTLVIHPNKATNGMIRISDLTQAIEESCAFDRVYSLGAVSERPNHTYVFHLSQHYPRPAGVKAQIDFRFGDGHDKIPLNNLSP